MKGRQGGTTATGLLPAPTGGPGFSVFPPDSFGGVAGFGFAEFPEDFTDPEPGVFRRPEAVHETFAVEAAGASRRLAGKVGPAVAELPQKGAGITFGAEDEADHGFQQIRLIFFAPALSAVKSGDRLGADLADQQRLFSVFWTGGEILQIAELFADRLPVEELILVGAVPAGIGVEGDDVGEIQTEVVFELVGAPCDRA